METKWLILAAFLLSGIYIVSSITVRFIVMHRRQRITDIIPNTSEGDILSEVSVREIQADFGITVQVKIKRKNIELSIPQGRAIRILCKREKVSD